MIKIEQPSVVSIYRTPERPSEIGVRRTRTSEDGTQCREVCVASMGGTTTWIPTHDYEGKELINGSHLRREDRVFF